MPEQKISQSSDASLKVELYPVLPDRIYFSISEAANLCLVQPHVLRYWERQFTALKPIKRRGRRYFTHQDVLYIRKIRELLYVKNFTIEGARAQLTQNEDHSGALVARHTQDIVSQTVSRLQDVLKLLNPINERSA